jgi:hypothetical protein
VTQGCRPATPTIPSRSPAQTSRSDNRCTGPEIHFSWLSSLAQTTSLLNISYGPIQGYTPKNNQFWGMSPEIPDVLHRKNVLDVP